MGFFKKLGREFKRATLDPISGLGGKKKKKAKIKNPLDKDTDEIEEEDLLGIEQYYRARQKQRQGRQSTILASRPMGMNSVLG